MQPPPGKMARSPESHRRALASDGRGGPEAQVYQEPRGAQRTPRARRADAVRIVGRIQVETAEVAEVAVWGLSFGAEG